MKYIIFTIALVIGVPSMTGVSLVSSKLRNLLFAGMIVTFLFGSKFSINIMSMEYYRGPVRGFEVTLADLICMAQILTIILRSANRVVWFPRFFLPLFTFFLFSIFNVYQSDYAIYGWFVIWQLFRVGMLYWCVFNFFVTQDCSTGSLSAIWLGYVGTGIIIFAITFKQKYLDGIYRAWAFFDHSNTVPSFVLIILCGLLVWGLYDRRLSMITFLLTLFASLGLVFATFSTGSRTGMVTAAGSVVCALVIANRGGSSSRLRLATIFMVVAMGIGGLMVVDTLIDRFLNAPESSEEARNEFEIAAVMMADDHQYGVGLNQYSQVLTMEEQYRKHIQVMKNETQGGVAHHIYLLTAAEMGYTGLYAFIVIIGLFEVSMIWYGLRWRTLEERLLLGLSVGILVFYLIGLYEWVFRQSPVLYQYVMAVGFGQALIVKVKQERSRTRRARTVR